MVVAAVAAAVAPLAVAAAAVAGVSAAVVVAFVSLLWLAPSEPGVHATASRDLPPRLSLPLPPSPRWSLCAWWLDGAARGSECRPWRAAGENEEAARTLELELLRLHRRLAPALRLLALSSRVDSEHGRTSV